MTPRTLLTTLAALLTLTAYAAFAQETKPTKQDVFFIYPLKTAKGADVEKSLQQLKQNGYFEKASHKLEGPFKLVTNPDTNALLVQTNTTDESQLRQIFATLDQGKTVE